MTARSFMIFCVCIIALAICSMTASASCLNQGMLNMIQDKNSLHYLEQVFPLCVSTKECGPAVKGLEKLKNVDPVRYAYLKGCALANGDCFKRNLEEAEKNLLYCSRYSRVCRTQLFNLYATFGPNPKNYEQFALSLASEGYKMAISFLIDLDVAEHKYADAYFWALVLYYSNDLQIQNTEKWVTEQRSYIESQGGNPDSVPGTNVNDTQIPGLKKWNAEIMPDIIRIGYHVPKSSWDKIRGLAYDFAAKPKKPAEGSDELESLANIYGLTGLTLAAPNTPSRPKMKKITPPKRDISAELREVQKALKELRQ